MNWLSYVEQRDSAGTTVVQNSIGKAERHKINAPARHPRYKTILEFDSTHDHHVRTNADGSQEIFAHKISIIGSYPRYYLTQKIDPRGNSVTIHYDILDRITTIEDSLGRHTHFSYEGSDLKIQSIAIGDAATPSQPTNRKVTITYDYLERLQSLTDAVGIVTSFSYDDDFIQSMETPYGETTFVRNSGIVQSSGGVSIEATDPLGRKERVEYSNWFTMGLLTEAPQSEAPPDSHPFVANNRWLHEGTTLHWDHKTFRTHPPSVDDTGQPVNRGFATQVHWMRKSDNAGISVPVRSSFKRPYVNRIWYSYPGRGYNMGTPMRVGLSALPDATFRITDSDNGLIQYTRYENNVHGHPTRMIDPVGRETESIYATNGIDLQEIRQKTGPSTWEMLTTFADYQNHLPWIITDASGQETNLIWNAKGQLETITDPLNRTTTLTYDYRLGFDPENDTPSGYGYLYQIEGPVSGSSTTFTYDSAGRVHTTTDSAVHTLIYEYDTLDRPTRIIYPDDTYEELTYGRPEEPADSNSPIIPSLDVHTHRDRLGRITTFRHNAIRQLMVVKDPEGRITQYDYCSCGAINRLIDANGNTTRWRYDIQGRLTKKIHPDKTEINYTYDPHSGQLATVTDALGQTLEYAWHLDDNLASVTPANPIHPTAAHHYTWDEHFDRIKTLTDGTGTTTWNYHPHDGQTLGAGQIDTISTTHLANSTIAHGYDELGRQTSRSINGTANASTREFDSLGRVDLETNRLGTFDYHYVAETPRIDRIDLPHNHSTHFSYQTAENDHRLTRIEHRFANSSVLAAHDYGHTADGTITRWTQERSGLATRSWHYGYDAATRLTSAILKDPTEAILQQHGWQYDPGDNRIAKWSADLQSAPKESVPSKFNKLNQLLTHGSGPTRIAGAIDEPGTVTINGIDAKMRNQTEFEAYHDLPPGTHQIEIEATDHSENTATQSYEITIANEPQEHFEYDLNGNLTERTGPNGTTTYHWDAYDRLIAIHYSDSTSSHFTYDGLSRRVAITQKDDHANITQERKFLWHGLTIAEERSGVDGTTVEKRFYPNGVELVTGPDAGTYTYRTDHLGSIREVVGASGSLIARWDYDAWGVPEHVSGTFDLDFKYTGHFYHAPSDLHLAPFRAYEAKLGRWINRDPIRESGGINLYGYVRNNAINLIDPLGLVDMNLTPRNQPVAVRGMDRWNPKNGTYTVGGHGSACGEGMTDAQGNKLTPERLAELIKNARNYTGGQNITLYMCNTGNHCPTGDNFAQRLANIMGVGVRAPNGYVVAAVFNDKPTQCWISDRPGDERNPELKYVWHEPQ